MLEIEQVVNVLKNSQWHNIDDIIKTSKLPELKVRRIVRFLAKYNFIKINETHQKVKMTASLQKFLDETKGEEALALGLNSSFTEGSF